MRSYERREKQTKKTVQSKGEPLTTSDMYVLAARTERQPNGDDVFSFFEDSSDDCDSFASTESTPDDNIHPQLHLHPTTALPSHRPDEHQCEECCEQWSVREKQEWNEETLPEHLKSTLQISDDPTRTLPNDVPDDWDAKAVCWNNISKRDVSGADNEIEIGRTHTKMGPCERNSQWMVLENEDQYAARNLTEAKNLPTRTNVHEDPRPSPYGRGGHVFYPGRPINKPRLDPTMETMGTSIVRKHEPS